VTKEDLAARRGLDSPVYDAAEDSHLLAETAAERLDPDDVALDVGTGSGYVAATVTEATDATVYGCDVNPHACRRACDAGVTGVRTDLVSGFRDGVFDWVLFNPPYLPTPPEVEDDDWMEHALSGGEDGRRVIRPFLDGVGRVLAPGGRVLLLVSSLTGLDEVRGRAAANDLQAESVAEEAFPFERLLVLELQSE
jgi:release factor glutamine methyltransferase